MPRPMRQRRERCATTGCGPVRATRPTSRTWNGGWCGPAPSSRRSRTWRRSYGPPVRRCPTSSTASAQLEDELVADLELWTAVRVAQRIDDDPGVVVGRDLGGDRPQRVARLHDVALARHRYRLELDHLWRRGALDLRHARDRPGAEHRHRSHGHGDQQDGEPPPADAGRAVG